jgi:hypothetical protein
MTVYPDKFTVDAKTVREKAAELTGQVTDGVHELVNKPSDSK